jgi:hypothetical protein
LPQSTVEDWANTGTGFQGKIDHHGPGKPFKDGYMNKMPATAAAQQTTEQQGEKVSWTLRSKAPRKVSELVWSLPAAAWTCHMHCKYFVLSCSSFRWCVVCAIVVSKQPAVLLSCPQLLALGADVTLFYPALLIAPLSCPLLVLMYATDIIMQGSADIGGEAVERVVGHNFTGDEALPPPPPA